MAYVPGTRLSALSRSVAGQRAIVTGAASGMGRATAHLFADEGARVVVADLQHEAVMVVVDEIARRARRRRRARGRLRRRFGRGDHSLVAATVEWAGGIDILVNNAGVAIANSAFQPTEQFEDGWARTIDVNLTAHARLIRAALPHLTASGAGRIVNIASTEAIVTSAGMVAYAATKAGVIGLTKSFAVELGRHGVTVNCICPGPITTGMTAAIPNDAKATYARRRVPLGRYGDPEEVAHMTLNLCLPSASFVNGAVIAVDGGMSIRHT